MPAISIVAPPVVLGNGCAAAAPGAVGRDTDAVLGDVAGFDRAVIQRLRDEGVVVG